MKVKKVTRYYSDCGRGFWKKSQALTHDKNCTCWKNPSHKTCLTCEHKNITKESEEVSGFMQTWETNNCKNPLMDMDLMFRPAHENAPQICINCPKWELKK